MNTHSEKNQYMVAFSDESYIKDNPSWHSEDSVWKSEQILNLLSNNSIKPSTVCDVGCGAGEIINQLSLTLRDSEFCGYETSQEAFELCKSKESKRVHFELGDILQKNVYYDLLLCIDVFD